MKRGFTVGDPRARAAGQKGGAIRGAQLQIVAIRKWIARYPDVRPEAARAIYLSAYGSGFATGRRWAKQGKGDVTT